MAAKGTVTMQDSAVEESTFQLVMDQLEEVVVTIVQEIRERPGVALAVFAAILGAALGTRLATRRRRAVPVRVARRAKRVGDMAELAGLAMRLLQNPIVRGLVLAAIERQIKRRFSA